MGYSQNHFIPPVLHVGLRSKDKKLYGYMAARDHKGKVIFPAGHDGRDPSLAIKDYENEPVTGIKVMKDSWYHWLIDPRGFAFGISEPNMNLILNHSNYTVKKGLSGKFVHSWRYGSHWLLPINCPDYESAKYWSDAQAMRVTAKDMEPGCLYENKEGDKLLYIGRYQYVDFSAQGYSSVADNKGTQHVFTYYPQNVTNNNYRHAGKKFFSYRGFTKLAKRLCNKPVKGYKKILEEFILSPYHTPFKEFEQVKCFDPAKHELVFDNSYRGVEQADVLVNINGQLCMSTLYTPDYDDRDYERGPKLKAKGTYAIKRYKVINPIPPMPKTAFDQAQRRPITLDELKDSMVNLIGYTEAGGKFQLYSGQCNNLKELDLA